MDFTFSLLAIAVVSTLSSSAAYFLMRRKFLGELERGRERELELGRRVYENAVLYEVSKRIGYLLDAQKIIEIISGSLGNIVRYSTVSYMVIDDQRQRVRFDCTVNEDVSRKFISEVKMNMLSTFSELNDRLLKESDVEEKISGRIVGEEGASMIASYFNLPIMVSGRTVGLINVSSKNEREYLRKDIEVLEKIAKQASDAVTSLHEVLENEKGKLEQAVESLADGMFMVDAKYSVVISNKKFESMLKMANAPRFFEIVNAFSGKLDVRSKVEEVLVSQNKVLEVEIIFEELTYRVSFARVVDKNNIPHGVVALFHDITHEKSLEKLRQDFTAMMVHELRSPLTSIKTTVEFLQGELGKVTEDELRKYFLTIENISHSMLEIVNDLLDVAKLEAGKFDVVCESGDIARVIRESVEQFKPVSEEKNIKLDVVVGENLPNAWLDKMRMKQVISNLLSNSFKYTNSGRVTVTVKKEVVNGSPVDILISVSDTGIGIEREAVGKLFSKYGQLKSGRVKAGAKSSGLGLFISKGIIEASGGKIWVESEGIGKGSTFYFTVPIATVDLVRKNAEANRTAVLASAGSKLVGYTSEKVGRA
ncbi:MAG: ATP-binding protein [Candidatus Curtissbacteria bacterium]|nr:ATP-binding protein [Candidatus Curtissbacteria bacterium]